MDQEPNPLDQMLGDQQSQHFPAPTQDKTIRKGSIELKHNDYLISPANNLFPVHRFSFQSPSPFKNNFSFFDQENSQFAQQHFPQGNHNNIKKITNILSFDENPAEKNGLQPQKEKASNQNSVNYDELRQFRKNSKGLRNLSNSVYKIVLQLKQTTYKQVADHLVYKLNSGEFGPIQQSSSKAKDEQNIKRRVYDALNVLISAEVIQKVGKTVYAQHGMSSQKVNLSGKASSKEFKNFGEQIARREQALQQKQQMVNSLKYKKQLLSSIFKRNKKKKYFYQQKINFPLIGVVYTRNSNQRPIQFNQNHDKLSLIAQQMTIIGDMDMLVKIGIDMLSQNIEEIMEGNDNSSIAGEDEQNYMQYERSVMKGKDDGQKQSGKGKQKVKMQVIKKQEDKIEKKQQRRTSRLLPSSSQK